MTFLFYSTFLENFRDMTSDGFQKFDQIDDFKILGNDTDRFLDNSLEPTIKASLLHDRKNEISKKK